MTHIKNISIKTFLAQQGITPTTERAGYGMYNSPLREEQIPSFKIDYTKNLWYDFGLGEGGSIIDLVMRLDNCTLAQACTKLEGDNFSSHRVEPSQLALSTQSPKPAESPLQIEDIKQLEDTRLLNYIRSRAIDVEIAKFYCREIHYSLNGKRFFAIGFGSDGGAWELRNAYFKGGTSPKSPTTFNRGFDTCLLFEGFMDMLSYLTLKKTVIPSLNVAVLNSVANLKRVDHFLSAHRTIHCFLDNDQAGRKALAQVEKLGVEVVDQSSYYRNHKDLNECTMAKAAMATPQRRVKV